MPKVADKVLAITKDWAEKYPNTLAALTQAIIKAQQELRQMQDFSEVWQMLVDFNIIRFACSEHQHVQQFYLIQDIIRNFVDDCADSSPQPKARFRNTAGYKSLNGNISIIQTSTRMTFLNSVLPATKIIKKPKPCI